MENERDSRVKIVQADARLQFYKQIRPKNYDGIEKPEPELIGKAHNKFETKNIRARQSGTTREAVWWESGTASVREHMWT